MSSGIRFAPSPTGRFHVGNLRTAWIAHWWARALGQRLIIRSEDIDTPRNITGAHARQLADLRSLNIQVDQVVIQSDRRARHWELFQRAVRDKIVYPCACSRKDIGRALESIASAPHHEIVQSSQAKPQHIYTGHCRELMLHGEPPAGGYSWRFKNQPNTGTSDFIIARTQNVSIDVDSFIPAYHWACAIDDADGDYALLVRAWDLYDALEIQRKIQSWIKGSTTTFAAVFHTSLVTRSDGGRLEKRTAGVTLEELKTKGIDAAQLLGVFKKSFHQQVEEYENSRVWGENLRHISLATELLY
jgi:glutamyl-tRNA synthetase